MAYLPVRSCLQRVEGCKGLLTGCPFYEQFLGGSFLSSHCWYISYKILYRSSMPGKMYQIFTSCNSSAAFILYLCESALSMEKKQWKALKITDLYLNNSIDTVNQRNFFNLMDQSFRLCKLPSASPQLRIQLVFRLVNAAAGKCRLICQLRIIQVDRWFRRTMQQLCIAL